MSETTPVAPQPHLDKKVFSISLLSLIAVSAFMVLEPDASVEWAVAARDWITHQFGWFYLFTGVLPLTFAGWLAFGRFGQVKFGARDEKPEYSTVSWVAMMFTASMGASLIAWGFAEPIFYIETPPMGLEPNSAAAFEWAHMYPLFHWGVVPWAIYCLPSVPIAYMLFVRRKPSLKISDSCEAAIARRGNRAMRTTIDVFVMIGIVGGVATSLGFGVPLVSSLAVALLGVPDNLVTQIGVIILWTAIFATSAYLGLKRGIKVLADLNLGLMFFVMAFILVLGPTVYILSISTNSLGLMMDNFFRISFWTDPISRSGFPEAWTIFYWAWWIAYAPMMGLFFGRISRGRTIRQVVVGIIGLGALGTFLFLSIAGAYVLHLESNDLLAAAEIMRDEGMAPLVAAVIGSLPYPTFIMTVVTVLSVVFYATTFDSAAYILASVCTNDLPSNREPHKLNRLAWALALGVIAIGLMVAGGIETIKAMSVVSSLPIIPIVFMMCYTVYKHLNNDFPHLNSKRVHALERPIR
ncbi:MAG: BCCT family transporter [Gammaproteobacteria bacterium]|nr:BCCT family transporter [Gammaproteobacteria bacterium]